MRFMIIRKADADTEARKMPSRDLAAAMMAYNEEMANAGVMLGGDGLRPTADGFRIQFTDGKPTVIDGPFAETKELVAGFWIWQVSSLEEAIEWVKRCPNPMTGPSEIEIRQVFTSEDFGEEFTPELRAREDALREQLGTPEER